MDDQEKAKKFKHHTYATTALPPLHAPLHAPLHRLSIQPLIPAYTLFQNGDDFIILLYLCCLALDASIPARNSFEFSRSDPGMEGQLT